MRALQIFVAALWCVFHASVNAQATTFDFTGTVTSATGSFSAIADGTPVTGTYTFDYSNVNFTTGTVGSDFFQVFSARGVGSPLPPLRGLIFTSTAHIGEFSYVTSPISGVQDVATIDAGNGRLEGTVINSDFTAEESVQLGAGGITTGSNFQIHGSTTTYDSDGFPHLPVVASTPPSSGGISFYDPSLKPTGHVFYSLDSLTRAPLIPAVPEAPVGQGLILGALVMGSAAFFRKRRARFAGRCSCAT